VLDENDIKKMFKEMGLGSQEEREKLKKLGEINNPKNSDESVFIISDSSTLVSGEKENAKLA